MTNKTVIALIIMAVVAVLLIFNVRDNVRIDLLLTQVSMIKSLAFLLFMALGVVVGLFLKG